MNDQNLSAIVTINDYKNYGNRLQNYALATLLKKYGSTVTIRQWFNVKATSVELIRSCLRPIKEWWIKVYANLFFNDKALIFRRELKGKEFTKRYIPDNEFSVSSRNGLKSKSSRTINRIVLGSDQVWNYRWVSHEDLAVRLGSFAPEDIPVISYAASIGFANVDIDAQPVFQKYLPRLRAISVREDRARELVQEMTGLPSTVVLDPTLMIDADHWRRLAEGFVSNDDKYVLTYFLGKPSSEQDSIIQEYAKKHGCRVRRILDLRDRETFVAGPADFVELFSRTQYVFTDSYHACCFSVLFHKQFTVFNRADMTGKANMNSRLETLFRLFDLNSVVMDTGLAPTIDYEKVDLLLAKHRASSQRWLDQAMEA